MHPNNDRIGLSIAIAKGYLFKESLRLLKPLGIDFDQEIEWSRRLYALDTTQTICVYQVRPWDVPEYVEKGAADLGIVGLDILHEKQPSVVQLKDLQFGHCRLVLAAPESFQKDRGYFHNMKVATKYPRSTEEYFRKQGIKIQLIKLYGAIELAPMTGLSDIVSDLTATGQTLKENHLHDIGCILSSSARLIANNTSFRFKYPKIDRLMKDIHRQQQPKS